MDTEGPGGERWTDNEVLYECVYWEADSFTSVVLMYFSSFAGSTWSVQYLAQTAACIESALHHREGWCYVTVRDGDNEKERVEV